jgi:hypothetical protein
LSNIGYFGLLAELVTCSLIPLPLYIIAIVVFIFVPEIQPVKSVPSEAQPMPDLSPASSFSVRLRIRLASVQEFLSKNIAVVMLTLVFFIIMFPGHPFALLYISKKFGTSLANVSIASYHSHIDEPTNQSGSQVTQHAQGHVPPDNPHHH